MNSVDLRQKPSEDLHDYFLRARDLMHALKSVTSHQKGSMDAGRQQVVHWAIKHYILGLHDISLQNILRGSLRNESLGAHYQTLLAAYQESRAQSWKLKEEPHSVLSMISDRERV